MSGSTGHGLAGAGALLVAFTLITPWFVMEAGGLQGEGLAGVAALGALSAVVLVAALLAGWSGSRRLHPLVPVVASGVLAVVVIGRLVRPPSVDAAIGSPAGNGLAAELARSFADALEQSFGVHYAPAWGGWLALIGAGMAVAGTVMVFLGERPDRVALPSPGTPGSPSTFGF